MFPGRAFVFICIVKQFYLYKQLHSIVTATVLHKCAIDVIFYAIEQLRDLQSISCYRYRQTLAYTALQCGPKLAFSPGMLCK